MRVFCFAFILIESASRKSEVRGQKLQSICLDVVNTLSMPETCNTIRYLLLVNSYY